MHCTHDTPSAADARALVQSHRVSATACCWTARRGLRRSLQTLATPSLRRRSLEPVQRIHAPRQPKDAGRIGGRTGRTYPVSSIRPVGVTYTCINKSCPLSRFDWVSPIRTGSTSCPPRRVTCVQSFGISRRSCRTWLPVASTAGRARRRDHIAMRCCIPGRMEWLLNILFAAPGNTVGVAGQCIGLVLSLLVVRDN